MGAKLSSGNRKKNEQPSNCGESSRVDERQNIQYIDAPYNGPTAEYKFLNIELMKEFCCIVKGQETKAGFTKSANIMTLLNDVYAEGFSLITSCVVLNRKLYSRVAGTHSSEDLLHHSIFCRYEGDPGNNGWTLSVEKSTMQLNHLTSCIIGKESSSRSQHIIQIISDTGEKGARLLSVFCTNQKFQAGKDRAVEVELFFEVPDKSTPEKSVYQLYVCPATYVKHSIFTTKGQVVCEWENIMAQHLSRGWRLVDIFCEVSNFVNRSFSLSSVSNDIYTVWFFEKPESRIRDESAVYEGAILEHWIDSSHDLDEAFSASLIPNASVGCLCVNNGNDEAYSCNRTESRLAIHNKKSDTEFYMCRGSSSQNSKYKAENAEAFLHRNQSDNTMETTDMCSESKHNSMLLENRSSCNDKAKKSCENPYPCSKHRCCGWENCIKSMGRKGWELATIINTLDTNTIQERTQAKVLLVFQRRLSLLMASVKSHRDAFRSNTHTSSAMSCESQLLVNDTVSGFNASMAVRLPLSRSTSKNHDYYNIGSVFNDVPSTERGETSSSCVEGNHQSTNEHSYCSSTAGESLQRSQSKHRAPAVVKVNNTSSTTDIDNCMLELVGTTTGRCENNVEAADYRSK